MRMLHRLRAFVRNTRRHSEVDRDLDRELRAYADLVADEKIREGASPEAARRAATIALGGLQQVKEEVRRARAGAWIDEISRDIRYALRGLRRSPVFACTAVVTLALGVGANTAMFSIIDALLFKPLPVADADQLVAAYRGTTGSARAFSYPEFAAIAGRTGVLRGAAAWGTQLAWLRDGSGTDRVSVHIVSANYFTVVGAAPAPGSSFSLTSEAASRGAAVIAERLWRTRFGGDPAILGRGVNLNGMPVTIVGVAPAGFIGLDPSAPADVWITFSTLAALEPGWDFRAPEEIWLRVTARLEAGVSRAAATAALPSTRARPAADEERIRLVPAATPIFDPAVRESSARLAALVGGVSLFVLLIACANVANLLLVRANARVRELGVRLAIGASRGRLARQMIVEAAVLATIGCASALVVAYWTVETVVAYAPPTAIPPGITVAFDQRVVAFAVFTSFVVTIVCGVAPAWQASRLDVLSQVKGGPGGVTGRAAFRFRRGLAVAQVALSTVLLVGAALFVRTLVATMSIAPGYDVDRVLLTTVDFTAAKLSAADAARAAEDVLRRVRALPTVEAAAFGQIVPFTGAMVERPAVPAGVPMRDSSEEDRFLVPYGVVSEAYFDTLGVPLRGRDFSSRDSADAPPVAIVNETLARRYWPGEDAIGRRLVLPIRGKGPEVEVVGIVRDGKYVRLTEEQRPYLYLPLRQVQRPRLTLHVRASSPATLAGPVRAAIGEVSPDIPAINPTTLQAYLERSTAQPRVVSRLLVMFAAVALVVAVVGVYGVTAYSVTRRSKELGIRVALGARPRDVVRMLVSQGVALVVVGVAIGLAGAVVLGRLVQTLLYGVSPVDPLVFGATSLGLIGTLLVATLLPARHAARVDPLLVLRND